VAGNWTQFSDCRITEARRKLPMPAYAEAQNTDEHPRSEKIAKSLI
jgi:hypothetical protein